MRVDLALGRMCKISPLPVLSSLRRSCIHMETLAQLYLHIFQHDSYLVQTPFRWRPGRYCVHPYMPVPNKIHTPLQKFNRSFESKLSCCSLHWAYAQTVCTAQSDFKKSKLKIKRSTMESEFSPTLATFWDYQKCTEHGFTAPLRTNDIFYSYQPSLLNEPWNHLKCAGVCMHACPGGQGGRGNQRRLIRKHSLFGTHNLI